MFIKSSLYIYQVISTNLIVLRKALGIDASKVFIKEREEISTVRFRPGEEVTGLGNMSEELGSQLIRTIGGRIMDIGPFDVGRTLVDDVQSVESRNITDVQRSSAR